MERMLDAINPPDLVLADHGFAGAAAIRRLPTVCFTDVNDPALAVAKADGLVRRGWRDLGEEWVERGGERLCRRRLEKRLSIVET